MLRDPMACSLPGSSVHGSSQARVLEWGTIAFSAGRRREVLFKMSLGEGGWATIVTWEWVQWSQEPDPAVPLEAKGWGGRGSRVVSVVSVGAPSSLLSAGLAPSTPATLWASPNLQSLSPTPTPGTWSEVGPLKTPLAKNEWGLEATSATRLYPYSEYPLCICKPSNLDSSSEFWPSTAGNLYRAELFKFRKIWVGDPHLFSGKRVPVTL